MKAIVQRVSRALVEVDTVVVGQIADGLLVLLGMTHADTERDADILVDKITKLRIFEDPFADSDRAGKMNASLLDTAGGLLVVSQFTLYADVQKGNRPSFGDASRPEHAELLYNYFVQKCIDTGLHVETGEFGTHMRVDSVNDGPVTIVLET